MSNEKFKCLKCGGTEFVVADYCNLDITGKKKIGELYVCISCSAPHLVAQDETGKPILPSNIFPMGK